jgi:hypothetical protein
LTFEGVHSDMPLVNQHLAKVSAQWPLLLLLLVDRRESHVAAGPSGRLGLSDRPPTVRHNDRCYDLFVIVFQASRPRRNLAAIAEL